MWVGSGLVVGVRLADLQQKPILLLAADFPGPSWLVWLGLRPNVPGRFRRPSQAPYWSVMGLASDARLNHCHDLPQGGLSGPGSRLPTHTQSSSRTCCGIRAGGDIIAIITTTTITAITVPKSPCCYPCCTSNPRQGSPRPHGRKGARYRGAAPARIGRLRPWDGA
jgi:hypothetical protein